MPLRIFQRVSCALKSLANQCVHQLRILKSGRLITRISPTLIVGATGTTSPNSPGMYQRMPNWCRKA